MAVGRSYPPTNFAQAIKKQPIVCGEAVGVAAVDTVQWLLRHISHIHLRCIQPHSALC